MKFVTWASVQSNTRFYRVLSVHYESDVFLSVVSSLKTTVSGLEDVTDLAYQFQ